MPMQRAGGNHAAQVWASFPLALTSASPECLPILMFGSWPRRYPGLLFRRLQCPVITTVQQQFRPWKSPYLLSLPTEMIFSLNYFCILEVLTKSVYFALSGTGMFLLPLEKVILYHFEGFYSTR